MQLGLRLKVQVVVDPAHVRGAVISALCGRGSAGAERRERAAPGRRRGLEVLSEAALHAAEVRHVGDISHHLRRAVALAREQLRQAVVGVVQSVSIDHEAMGRGVGPREEARGARQGPGGGGDALVVEGETTR